MRHEFAHGKYILIYNNGKLTALRHGELWDRHLTGDSLVYWMLIEVNQLKAQREEMLAALNELASWGQGEVVNSSFDNPSVAEFARATIAKVRGIAS